MTFASLGLIDPLLRTPDALDYRTPTPVQKEAIPAVLKGRDLLAAAQTGTGKTAGFTLPLLQKLTLQGPKVASNSVRALVLTPTRELAEQVQQSVQRYGENLPLRSYAAYGGVSINPQMMALRKGIDLLVATPGRLLDLYRQNAVRFEQLQVLVLDEADRMLDLGFARELDELFAALPKKRQTLLFSATFSDAIRQLAGELLRDPLNIEVAPRNTAAKSVKQWLIPVDKKRKSELFLHLLAEQRWGQVLVFAKTRKGVDQLVEEVQAAGFAADSIHGDKPQPSRLRETSATTTSTPPTSTSGKSGKKPGPPQPSSDTTTTFFAPSDFTCVATSGAVISPSRCEPSIGWPPVMAMAPFNRILNVMFTFAATVARIASRPEWK